MNGERPVQARLNVDLSKCESLACKCGNESFTEVITLKKISALLSPTGREMVAQLRQLTCLKCNETFVLEEAKDKKEINGQERGDSAVDP